MNDIIKKWADFSESETKPLFWMLFGPLLMMLTLTLAIPTLSNPFLPFVTVSGLILSWRYRISGFSLTLMLFILYFGLTYFFGHREAFLWKAGWGCSLILGLTISFLSMEELKSYYAKLKAGKEKALRDLHISLQSFEEKAATEARTQDKEIETLKEELKSSCNEVEALLGLVEASRIETDKMYKQSDLLSTESLAMHRNIETLKAELEEKEALHETLTKEYDRAAHAAKERLAQLNTLRVEHYQFRLLFEGAQRQLKRARDYFRTQKKEVAMPPPPRPDNNQKLVLKTLEKDKGTVKVTYDTLLTDYQKLKASLEVGTLKLQKAPDEALSLQVKELTLEVQEKKRKLDQTKSELIGIERQIFVIKKGLQQTGAYAR